MANNFQSSPLSQIVPVASKRTKTDALNNSKTHYFDLTVRGHLSVTVAGAGVLNRGSLWAAFSELGILEAGKPVWLADPRVLAYVSECASPSSISATRAVNANVQETDLVETMRLYFADPLTAHPWETAFMEHNITLGFQVFATQAANAAANLIDGGTAALSNLTIDVVQGHDDADSRLPLLRVEVEAKELAVNGASAALPIKIDVSDRLRGICISQIDTNKGEVTDVINSVIFRGDKKYIIGDNAMPWDDLARAQERLYGGDVYSGPKGAHVYLNFQQFGRLANALNPVTQDTNLRMLFNCQKSAVGTGDSKIWLTLFKLVHDLQQGPSGRYVTDPNLPFGG